jgi:preprotein translocase subunit SecA
MTDVVIRRAKHAEAALTRVKVPDDVKEEVREILARPARLDGRKARAVADRVVELAPKSDLAFWVDGVAKAADALDAIRAGIPHNVLNAKNHEREAEFVAQAGRVGALTLATNMAGRGTDILLGGNPEFLARTELKAEGLDWKTDVERYKQLLEKYRAQCEVEKKKVIECGGLHVLGTERHEARRIDNQLRGRCARQGDPGSSRFYLSLEDDLMRIFANDRVQRILELVGMTEDVDIQSGMVSRSIRRAQKRVEDRNFEIRKNLLEYDEVMDKQRRTVYGLRQEVLEGSDVKERILEMVADDVERIVGLYIAEKPERKDYEEAARTVNQKFLTSVDGGKFVGKEDGALADALIDAAKQVYEEREKTFTAEALRKIERSLLLQVIDTKWKDHLINVDALRSGIGLRSYGQIDPKNEFKKEGFRLFEEMLTSIGDEVLMVLYRLRIEPKPPAGGEGPGGPGPSPSGVPPSGPVPTLTFSAGAPAPRLPLPAMATNGGAPPLSRPPIGPSRPLALPTAQAVKPPAPTADAVATRKAMDTAAGTTAGRGVSAPIGRAPPAGQLPKVGRNDDCPCGSGRKYKKCHGKPAA